MLSHKCTERQQEKSGTAHRNCCPCLIFRIMATIYNECSLAKAPKICTHQKQATPPNATKYTNAQSQISSGCSPYSTQGKAFEGQTRTYTLSLEDPTGTIMCNSPSHTPPLKISIDIDPFPLVNRVIPSHHHS